LWAAGCLSDHQARCSARASLPPDRPSPPPPDPPSPQVKRSAQLAAAQAAAAAGAKRPRGDAEVDASDPGQEVAPGVLRRRVMNPHRPVVEGTTAAENISQGQLDPTAPVPALEPPPQYDQQQQGGAGEEGGDAMEGVERGGNQQDGGGGGGGEAVSTSRYLMPMHASWFSIFAIHNYERRGLPELFNNSIPGYNIKVIG
jgi:hypothetical protein